MKKCFLATLLSLIALTAIAQEVWTEGTTWDVEYSGGTNLPHTLFTLSAAVEVEGTMYYPLTATTATESKIVAYIRSERGDTLVFARVIKEGALLPETLLYDFSKSFEYGDEIRYGTMDGVITRTINVSDGQLEYLNDVFESGDQLPVWDNLIYKLGHIEGPLGFIFSIPDIDASSSVKPKVKNVSHILFGTKKGVRRAISVQSELPSDLLVAYRNFAFDLLGNLEAQAEKGQNIVISPLSAQIALGMLENGAAGNTLTEIQNVMHAKQHTLEEQNKYGKALIERLLTKSDQNIPEEGNQEAIPTLELANSIWSDTGFPFLESFYNVNKSYYHAELQTVDLSEQSSIETVDKWVSEKTHNTIPSINVEANDDLRMLLVNALYFKAGWASPFEKMMTKAVPFHNQNGTMTDVETMHQLSKFKYYDNQDFKALKLPYGYDDRYSMTIFIAQDAETEFSFSTKNWEDAQESMRTLGVELRLPKFTIDCDFPFNQVLYAMGMKEAFSPMDANFSLMSTKSLFVDFVKQLSHIEIDEDGTIASAATVIGMVDASVEPIEKNFFVDRPFYFTIEDNETTQLLFIGHIQNLESGSSGISTIEPTKNLGEIYDLQGRKLHSITQKGMYIMNGKKYFRK